MEKDARQREHEREKERKKVREREKHSSYINGFSLRDKKSKRVKGKEKKNEKNPGFVSLVIVLVVLFHFLSLCLPSLHVTESSISLHLF
jgi:hypothetical protein